MTTTITRIHSTDKWTHADEMGFVRDLGAHSGRDKNLSVHDKTMRRRLLLIKYITLSARRKRWNDIKKAEVITYINKMLGWGV